MILLPVKSGEEIIDSLTRQLAERGVRSGAIVSLIGAVEGCCISNMPGDDASKDILTEYSEPFEMAGTGEIVDGKPHIHCVLGTENANQAIAGHLHWANVKTWFANAYVQTLE